MDYGNPKTVTSDNGLPFNNKIFKDFAMTKFVFFKQLGFTPCKAEQPLRGMELQEKKHKKDYRLQKICLERTYS